MFRHQALNERSLDGKYKAIPEAPLLVVNIIQNIKKKTDEALELFKRLFFCYRLPSSIDNLAIELMLKGIGSNQIDLTCEFISTPPKIHSGLKNKGSSQGRTSESAEHQGMKKWVIDYLKSKQLMASEEVSFLGYKLDVGVLANKIFIECGDTEPKKAFDFLYNLNPMGILQYNSEYITWLKPSEDFPMAFSREAFEFFGLPPATIRQR